MLTGDGEISIAMSERWNVQKKYESNCIFIQCLGLSYLISMQNKKNAGEEDSESNRVTTHEQMLSQN